MATFSGNLNDLMSRADGIDKVIMVGIRQRELFNVILKRASQISATAIYIDKVTSDDHRTKVSFAIKDKVTETYQIAEYQFQTFIQTINRIFKLGRRQKEKNILLNIKATNLNFALRACYTENADRTPHHIYLHLRKLMFTHYID